MSKVENQKVKIDNTKDFNDKDMLQDLLNDEKNISNNLSIALNEMSNASLYDEVFRMFQDTKDTARILFDLMFKMGWYSLEEAGKTKIDQEITKFEKELEDLK